MTVQEHVPLSEHTTFRVGGPARFFAEVHSTEELRKAVSFAHTNTVPWFVLGGGSNTLVREAGFSGLIIKIVLHGVSFQDANIGSVLVTAAAGENWDALVAETVARGLWGLENLSLIPGTVGGAPVQNIGAYGVEIKNVLECVEVLNTETNSIETLSADMCQFGYRDSLFKKPEGKKYIILSVTLRLSITPNPNLTYKDVAEHFASSGEEPTLAALRAAIMQIRERKLPNVAEVGTAGSFFKNPFISGEKLAELKQSYPDIRVFPSTGERVKVSAAWLLDHIARAKELSVGDVAVWPAQSLVLVNRGSASATEVESLATQLEHRVAEATGIILEREVVTV